MTSLDQSINLPQLLKDNPELEALAFSFYQAGMADGIAVEKNRQIDEAANQAREFFASLPQQPISTATPLYATTK
ncbi:MAG: hypothetical protein L0G87_02785 [Renibacterium salmoninarum]|nr:hypothetical protein [Renibacterium salmoninarum]